MPNGGVLPARARALAAQQPATVAWIEALDGGDPKATVAHRDKLMALAAPFSGTPSEIARTEWRAGAPSWTDAGVLMVTENDRQTRMTRTWLLDQPGATPRKLWDRSQEDSYANPGTPLRRPMGSGVRRRAPGRRRDLPGRGRLHALTAIGRSWIARLKSGQNQRLFRSEDQAYETVIGLVTTDAARVVTRRETREISRTSTPAT